MRSAIELRQSVITSADHRQDFSGARVECYQRRLQRSIAALQVRMIALESLEAVAHGLLGGALQLHIHRGEHRQASLEGFPPMGGDKLFGDEIGEVPSDASGPCPTSDPEWGAPRLAMHTVRNDPPIVHHVQHQVSPLPGRLGSSDGMVQVGTLDDAGQERTLSDVELAGVLAEVVLRGTPDTMDG